MKNLNTSLLVLAGVCLTAAKVSAQSANTSLSNLVSPTHVNQSLTPNTTNTISLGSSTIGWQNCYLTGALYLDGLSFINNNGPTNAWNTFVGAYVGISTTGINDAAVGAEALQNNTSGSNNSALGSGSLFNNTTGGDNSALGGSTLYYNTSGYDNTAIGYRSLYTNQTASYSTAIGSNSDIEVV